MIRFFNLLVFFRCHFNAPLKKKKIAKCPKRLKMLGELPSIYYLHFIR